MGAEINSVNEFEDLAKSIADAPTAIAFDETYLNQTKD
jgi:glyoxylate carboligase